MRTFSFAPKSFGRLVLMLCLGAASVACGPPPPPKKVESAEDRAEKDKFLKAKKLIEKADVAYGDKDFDKARKLLREANEMGIESLVFDIKEQTEKVDKRHAKLWANEIKDVLGEGDCKGAFKQLAAPMQDLESDVFNREVRHLIGGDLLKCLQVKIDASISDGKFAEARTLAMHADTKIVLGAPAHKKVVATVEETILEQLKTGIAEPIRSKRWTDAMSAAEEAVKKGDTNVDGGKVLLAMVREAIAPEIAALAQRNITQRDAAKALVEVDQLIKLVKWDPEGAAKETSPPETVLKKRGALTTWIEAQRLRFKPEKKPEKRFTHGKVGILPAAKTDAPSKRDLVPATPVWIIGQAKGLALVTEVDPGKAPLEDLFEKALGWAPMTRLSPKNTTDWLPPDDQLAGLRVWAPLRADEPNLELGYVVSSKGQDVVVKRVADDKEITVKKSVLRLGRITPGMRILANCQAKMQITLVEELMLDQRTVKLVCEGGLRKDEVLPGLRVRPEDLPVVKQ